VKKRLRFKIIEKGQPTTKGDKISVSSIRSTSSATSAVKPEKPQYPFWEEVKMFTDRIDALSSTLPLITALTVQMVTQVAEELKKAAAMAQSTQREYEEAPTRRKLEIITARNTQIRKATHTVNQTRVTVIDIPRSFLITLVSQFDTFLGG